MQLELVRNKIYEIRGHKVMVDRDLAQMYGVETRVLNQAVKRNIERFPEDFMFQLTDEETENWKSQIVMSNSVKMGGSTEVRGGLFAFGKPRKPPPQAAARTSFSYRRRLAQLLFITYVHQPHKTELAPRHPALVAGSHQRLCFTRANRCFSR